MHCIAVSGVDQLHGLMHLRASGVVEVGYGTPETLCRAH